MFEQIFFGLWISTYDISKDPQQGISKTSKNIQTIDLFMNTLSQSSELVDKDKESGYEREEY